MIVSELFLNNKLIMTAAASDLTLLTFMLDAFKGDKSVSDLRSKDYAKLSLSGLRDKTPINWIKCLFLNINDEILFKISDVMPSNKEFTLISDIKEDYEVDINNIIAFEVKKNGQKLYTAGSKDISGLHMGVTGRGKLGDQLGQNNDQDRELNFFVAGHNAKDKTAPLLYWTNHEHLQVGDELEIKIIDTNKIDPPRPVKEEEPSSP